MSLGLDKEERAAIEEYFACGGEVTWIAAKAAHSPVRRDVDAPEEPRLSLAPPPRRVRHMSIREALEWAFGTEGAKLGYGDGSGQGLPSYGMEFILMEQAMLGQRVDVSRGRSFPADDAELIALVVRNWLPQYAALQVARLASARLTPWDGAVQPVVEPCDWVCGRGGKWRGKAADARELGTIGWAPVERINRRGRKVCEPVLYTPCRWVVSAARIAENRRAYLEWWGWLQNLRTAVECCGLRWISITPDMPARRPWREGEGSS